MYGQTTVNWLPWLLGGAAVLVVGSGLIVFLRDRAHKPVVSPPAPPGS